MMSLRASGTVGHAVTFSRWKGRAYVRSTVKPKNPKSQGQKSVRATVSFFAQQWKTLASASQATWSASAKTLKISNYNAYVRQNQKLINTLLPPGQAYSQTKSTTAPTSPTLAFATIGLTRTLTITPGANSAGWGWQVFANSVAITAMALAKTMTVVPTASAASTSVALRIPTGWTSLFVWVVGFNADGVYGAGTSASTS
jgi:hypothetical protein